MVNQDNSPLSPAKNGLTESQMSRRESGFTGFIIKETVDVNTNNFGARVARTGSSNSNRPEKKKDIIPANPILPRIVCNEIK
jgi:hypothetical protein